MATKGGGAQAPRDDFYYVLVFLTDAAFYEFPFKVRRPPS
jgi:hypothetical protein